MSSLTKRQQTAQIERRRTGRMLIEVPMSFKTVSGVRECQMTNISDSGAMLEMESPPATGVSGWLVMGDDEIYCTVIWAKEASCGIEFERALGSHTLEQYVSDNTREAGPAANRSNIQMGRKRSSLVMRRD